MKPHIPKLTLDFDEKDRLAEAGISLSRLASCDPAELARRTELDLQRCEELVALAQFQALRSVGPRSAEDLWALGFRSLADLRGADPAGMYRRLMEIAGRTMDPCVEDVFRCAVAQATYPKLPEPLRDWWAWKEQRGEPTVRLPGRQGD